MRRPLAVSGRRAHIAELSVGAPCSMGTLPRAPLPVLVTGDVAGPPGDDPARRRSESALPGSAPAYVILVVDDDPTILQAVAEALGMTGYAVSTAKNGAEALQATEAIHPHMVLLDLRMPVMDGWEFVRRIRERQLGPKIVVMTATTDARSQAEALEADAYLAKPFGLDQLLATVERLRKRG